MVQIDGMTSHLAQLGFTKQPKMIPKVVRANLKKRMQQDERLASIEAENARLLSQMTRIMDAPDQLSRLKKPPLSSLNVVTRRREMERVTHENLRMLRALEDTPSYYNHRVWMAERREQEHMLSYIGMYPYHEGTGVRAKAHSRAHTDVDDVWLRSVTSLSRKSALSLPELTKGREMRFSRSESPGQPWALPVMPGQEHMHAHGHSMGGDAPLDRSELNESGATAPMQVGRGVQSMDKLRADSSSESEGEEEEEAASIKKADEPKPALHSVSQSKPSAPADDSDDESPAKAKTLDPAPPVAKSNSAEEGKQEQAAPPGTAGSSDAAPPPASAEAPNEDTEAKAATPPPLQQEAPATAASETEAPDADQPATAASNAEEKDKEVAAEGTPPADTPATDAPAADEPAADNPAADTPAGAAPAE